MQNPALISKLFIMFIGLAATLNMSFAEEIPFVYDGHLKQGGYIIGQTSPDVVVSYKGKNQSLTPMGYFFIGFGRDAELSHSIKLSHPNGDSKVATLKLEKRTYEIQRIDGLPPKKVTPDEKHLARIRKEGAMASSARTHNFPNEYFLEEFIWPSIGRISGVYGSQRVLNGQPRRPHFGVDVAAPTGSPVVAPAGGVVTLVHDDMYFSGGTLIVDHGYGVSSTFIHLSKILVEEDQVVKQGDLIAEIGATGRVTGPHLDWRMNWFKERIDPTSFVGEMPKNN